MRRGKQVMISSIFKPAFNSLHHLQIKVNALLIVLSNNGSNNYLNATFLYSKIL